MLCMHRKTQEDLIYDRRVLVSFEAWS